MPNNRAYSHLTDAKHPTNFLLAVLICRVKFSYVLYIFRSEFAVAISFSRIRMSLLDIVSRIISGSARKKVRWVHAQGSVAVVAGEHSFSELSLMQFIRIAVRSLLIILLYPKIAITSSRFSSNPYPTSIFFLLHKAKKSDLSWYPYPLIPGADAFLKAHGYMVPRLIL